MEMAVVGILAVVGISVFIAMAIVVRTPKDYDDIDWGLDPEDEDEL